MATWIGRHIDDELWRKFKARAAAEGRGLRWIVLTLIEHYTAHGLPTNPPLPPGQLRYQHGPLGTRTDQSDSA